MRPRRLIVALLVGMAILCSVPAGNSTLSMGLKASEDALWLLMFVLLMVFGWLMRRLSAGLYKVGYLLLAVTGLMGLVWKAIELAHGLEVFAGDLWLLHVAWATSQGLTGIALATAFVTLIYSLIKIFEE